MPKLFHLAVLHAEYERLLRFINAPWSIHKIVWIAAAALSSIILYTALRINWTAQIGAVPYRIGLAWALQKKNLGNGLAFLAGGILLAWYTWRHVYQLHEISGWWTGPLAVVAIGMMGTGALSTLEAALEILFSPFNGEMPIQRPGLDMVHQQKAHGDAGPAEADEVDRALRGPGGGPRREFED